MSERWSKERIDAFIYYCGVGGKDFFERFPITGDFEKDFETVAPSDTWEVRDPLDNLCRIRYWNKALSDSKSPEYIKLASAYLEQLYQNYDQ